MICVFEAAQAEWYSLEQNWNYLNTAEIIVIWRYDAGFHKENDT
jgi:hypothetical protein